jgi:hypothetical protein
MTPPGFSMRGIDRAHFRGMKIFLIFFSFSQGIEKNREILLEPVSGQRFHGSTMRAINSPRKLVKN